MKNKQTKPSSLNQKNKTTSPEELAQAAQLYATVIEALHKNFTPHEGQVIIGRSIFNDNKDEVFMQCGRQFGKSTMCAYIAARFGGLNANSRIYYFCPQRKQVKKTFWDKLLLFLPKELVADTNISDLTVTLYNGSKIICDGSEDIDSTRGISADLLIIDEFKDFNPEFWPEVGEPSLTATRGKVVFLGTPPRRKNKNYEGYLMLSNQIRLNKDGAWFKFKSEVNPLQSKERLAKIKARLESLHMLDVWMREYEAEIVEGGADAVFPMFREQEHCVSAEEIKGFISRDMKKFDWYVITDPASTTCFAALIIALNPYTKQYYILDEIYEKRMEYMSSQVIWPEILEKMRRWNPELPVHEWIVVYDEAAAWFANEIMFNYNIGMIPTEKHINKKENGLSLIKDQMLKRKMLINRDDCPNLIVEILAYMLDEKGEIPKKNDHLIDCTRYFNGACNYMFLIEDEPVNKKNEKPFTIHRPEDTETW